MSSLLKCCSEVKFDRSGESENNKDPHNKYNRCIYNPLYVLLFLALLEIYASMII